MGQRIWDKGICKELGLQFKWVMVTMAIKVKLGGLGFRCIRMFRFKGSEDELLMVLVVRGIMGMLFHMNPLNNIHSHYGHI